VAAVAAAALAAGSALAAPPAPATSATGIVQPASASGRTVSVTLITGDTVAVTTAPDGSQSAQAVPKAGTSSRFETTTDAKGDLYVYPDDALAAVAAGTVDPALFDVTRQIADGRTDATGTTVPIIVGYSGKPSAATLTKNTAALPASHRKVVLPKLGMAGLTVDKAHAKDFWQSVRPKSVTRGAGGRPRAPLAATGMTKIWYDGIDKAALDVSVPLIGAPQAWAEGYDGTGVTVAVLDTGIDATHPDLAGRIQDEQSFVPTVSTAVDDNGHGTHVADTIVGSGAASGGKYKGVAPGAHLLVGKVLDGSGSGETSWILAGMEWAVQQNAKIVSMSLGGPAASGGDVMTQAVDQLSATSGTLFVIAAGNAGAAGSIGSPGDAPSALTVGATDNTDALTNFSSRGPSAINDGIKPEITAPGLNITAARAAGTSLGTPVDQYYTTLSGTSMATPHVAGSAAIIAQRHPDWTGQQIKADLTGNAKLLDGLTAYQQGNGRVDIPPALDPWLELSAATVDFGLITYSDSGYTPQTRTVTLTNPGTSDLTVQATASAAGPDGTALPAGSLTLSAGTITIPAGGTAQETVTLDPTQADSGLYSGDLLLTGPDGRTVHAAIGFDKEPQRRGLTLTFKDRHGAAPSKAWFVVLGTDNTFESITVTGTDTWTGRLPIATYSVIGQVVTGGGAHASTDAAVDYFALPQIDLTSQDQARTVDAEQAKDITMSVQGEKRPLEGSVFSIQVNRWNKDRNGRATMGTTGVLDNFDTRYGAIPSEKADQGELYTSVFITEREPIIQGSVEGPDGFDLGLKTSSYMTRFSGTRELSVVDAGAGTAADIAAVDVKGKAALLHADNLLAVSAQGKALAAAGAAAVLLVRNNDDPQLTLPIGVPVPAPTVGYTQGLRLQAALADHPVQIELTGVDEARYAYSAEYDDAGAISASQDRRPSVGDFATVDRAFHSDQAGRAGWEAENSWGPYPMTSFRVTQVLHQGGEREDHLLAGPNRTYSATVTATQGAYNARMSEVNATAYQAGGHLTSTWFAAPEHPSAASNAPCNMCRTDQGVVFSTGVGGDSDPTHGQLGGSSTAYTFYRDGQLITDSSKVLVPQPASYTIVEDVHRSAADTTGVSLGADVSTAWTFGSKAPTAMSLPGCTLVVPAAQTCEALPVLIPQYDVRLDLLNQANAKSGSEFTLSATRPVGWTGSTRVSGAKVSVSYDDGATWQQVEVHPGKGDHTFTVEVPHSSKAAPGGYVSLKSELWDSSGDRTVQTVTRAYALK